MVAGRYGGSIGGVGGVRDDRGAVRVSVSVMCQKYVSLGALRTRSPRVSRACIEYTFDLNTHRPTTPSSDRQTDISECH